jgi:hypothetical protein
LTAIDHALPAARVFRVERAVDFPHERTPLPYSA